MSKRRACVWAGIDAGKDHHWAAAVDETGATLWSKKIDNDESAILSALGEILDLANEVRWAVDISGTASALLLALLAAHGQQAAYVPGRTVNRMAGAYRGEAKTDARDAYIIAETRLTKVPLVLLTGYQTPAAIRRRGRARLTTWLANRGVRSADAVAVTALEAARTQ